MSDTYQDRRQIVVAFKEETTYGQLPGATGASVFRANSGSLSMTRATIESGENRSDGQRTRGRLGSKTVNGSYTGDLSVGSFDPLIEAAFRGTFAAAATITQANLGAGTIAVAGNVVTITGGSSPIDAGVRVGQVHRWASGLDAADQNRNLRVTAVTGTSITYADTITDVAGPVSTYSFTIPKTLLMGTTRRSFAFEEYEGNIDDSEVFTGVRVGSLGVNLSPDGMGVITVGLVGQDMQVMEDGSAPYFTTPSSTTTLGLTALEASLRLGSTDLVDLTALNLNIDLNASGVPVIGATRTPDVFDNLATVTGSATALRKDLARVKNFLAEDALSLHILFADNGAAPQGFCSFYVGNLVLSAATKSELGQDGGRTQDLQFLIGKDERGGEHPLTTVMYQTSAA